MAEFADISSWQRGADLATYARGGYERIVLKATEGTEYRNPHFLPWWAVAGALGLVRGAYHYAQPSMVRSSVLNAETAVLGHQMGDGYRAYVEEAKEEDEDAQSVTPVLTATRATVQAIQADGRAEAEHFARTLALAGFGRRDCVWLDTEDPSERGSAAAVHAVAFCWRMVDLGFRRGIVYSYSPYLTGCGLTADMLPPGWRQLHVANYGATPDDRVPLPARWDRSRVVARQYTSSAIQPGIPGRSDANRVVRDWLTPNDEDGTVTEQDKTDIANRVLEALRVQVFSVSPPIKQSGPGQTIGASYNKIGDVQSTLTAHGTGLGWVGNAIALAREEAAANAEFLYGALYQLAAGSGVTLDMGEPPWREPNAIV